MTHPYLIALAVIGALIAFRLIRRLYIVVKFARSVRIRRHS